jgi:hypothetical protein
LENVNDRKPVQEELVLSHWLRCELTEQTIVPAIALFLHNDLIQFKFAENIKIIMRTVEALGTANVNLTQVVERGIAPVALLAMDKLLQERLQNLKPSKADAKYIKNKTTDVALDTLFQLEGYKLLTQSELEEAKAVDIYDRVLVLSPQRRQFYRRMIRFLDKYLRVGAFQDCAPLIASSIANDSMIAFVKSLSID